MSERVEYFLQAEQCKTFADKAMDFETKAKWLELAGKWLMLAGKGETPDEQFEAAVRDRGTGQERSRSSN